MAKQGFIKLHRKIQEHWIYQEKRKFSKYEAWLDMLMLANHKDNKFVHGNELLLVKRGEFITSIRKLGERWGWSNTKVTQFLDLLKADEMLDYKKDTKKTAITIANYGVYHGADDEEKTQKEHEKDTNRTQKHTNKNVKECIKNDKEKDYTSKIKDLLSRYDSITDFKKLNKQYWDVIRETRKNNQVAASVIIKTTEKWEKYDPIIVQYALKTHIEAHAGKKEEYTIGIMRGTSLEDAIDRLNTKKQTPKSKGYDWDKLREEIGE